VNDPMALVVFILGIGILILAARWFGQPPEDW
jgi:hypothetical protein